MWNHNHHHVGISIGNSMVSRVFGINTASDISKLSLISRATSASDIKDNFEISRAVFMPNTPWNHAVICF